MKASQVHIAKYNPRKMTKEARKALKKSISEFSDISGITINSKTGNVVSGNHRWEELCSKYGSLELQKVFEDRFAIMADGDYTGFMARIVNWSLIKEKQANIVANSSHISGEWSTGLQDILKELSQDSEIELLEDLRLSEMIIDLSATDDDLDLEGENLKREKTAKKEEDYKIEDDEKKMNSEVREIVSTLKITIPSEYKDDVLDAVVGVLSKKEYYDKITIF